MTLLSEGPRERFEPLNTTSRGSGRTLPSCWRRKLVNRMVLWLTLQPSSLTPGCHTGDCVLSVDSPVSTPALPVAPDTAASGVSRLMRTQGVSSGLRDYRREYLLITDRREYSVIILLTKLIDDNIQGHRMMTECEENETNKCPLTTLKISILNYGEGCMKLNFELVISPCTRGLCLASGAGVTGVTDLG